MNKQEYDRSLKALLEIACDLTLNLSSEERYDRLLAGLVRVISCDAAVLLRRRGETLCPLAMVGLSRDGMGRTFQIKEHARFKEIIESKEVVAFDHDDPRPDPYDGLIPWESSDSAHVHSCMGSSLRVRGEVIGALTVDALAPGRFGAREIQLMEMVASLASASLHTTQLIDALKRGGERQGLVTQHLLSAALQREGGEVLGESPAIVLLREEVELVACSELTALITGETGTGKELVARTIHALSPRRDRPLVQINCAALPESIAESELFGHVKGAFTGAIKDRVGKFELAHEATLFLDEIGELPLSIQAKLLRVLQFGEVQSIGSDVTTKVDVRVIAATNRDLQTEVEAGRFRSDLYHRLCVYPIHLPALRARREDIALLAGHLLDRARLRLGVGPIRLAATAREQLERYDWPGNIRELDHVVTRAALRASCHAKEGLLFIEPHHLDLTISSGVTLEASESVIIEEGEVEVEALSFTEAVKEHKRLLISNAVKKSNGNWSKAAKRLQMDRGNLHRLAQRLGLKRAS